MEPSHNNRESSRNRRLVSQLLVAALFAVAYSQMVKPVTAAFNQDGVNLQTLAWPLIYMMTVLRFFIGNILHLESPDLIGPRAAFRWFWDLFFIVMQCVVLIFAGAVVTVKTSATSTVSFTDYLLVLYGLDIVWLASMRVLHWFGQAWPRFFGPMVRERDLAPLEWAIVNLILGLVIWGVDLAGNHPPEIDAWKLWVLIGVNALVFLDDLVDIAYGIREPEGADVSAFSPPIRTRWWTAGLTSGSRGAGGGNSRSGMELAIESARQSLHENGIPVGAALLDHQGRVMGVGHNRRLQRDSPILHAEMDCLSNASRRESYVGTTLYSTLMPCFMCAGAIIQFGIPKIVIGESENFPGAKELLIAHGVEIEDLDDPVCKAMLGEFIQQNPQTWKEDIGHH